MSKRKSATKKRVSRKKYPKKRASKKHASKKRASKKHASKKHASKKRASKKRMSGKKYKTSRPSKQAHVHTLSNLDTRLKRIETILFAEDDTGVVATRPPILARGFTEEAEKDLDALIAEPDYDDDLFGDSL